MKASGNGRPEQCAANLLKITIGEVPYERLKGLTAGAIDEPTQQASISLEADAEWLIRTYEPRVDINDIEISINNQREGAYLLGADINVKREEGSDG